MDEPTSIVEADPSAATGGGGSAAPLLKTQSLSKHYPGVDALVDVDFELKSGEVHVLFGENGAGKSTLISILAGANQPSKGRILMRGVPVALDDVHAARRRGISAVFQEFSLVPQLTVGENLFLGEEPTRGPFLDKVTQRREGMALLERLGFPLRTNQRVMFLSRAEQQMLEIAKAFRGKLSVLILDEPTASLTEQETERLFDLVGQAKASGVGIIYITHRMAEIKRIGDRVTVLRDGRYIGTVPVAEASEPRLIQMMTGRPITQVFPKVAYAPGELLLETKNLTTVSGSVHDVSIKVHAGEIVGIAGLVGSGKSEVGRTCFGLEAVESGSITFRGEAVAGLKPRAMLDRGLFYLPPDRREEGLILIRNTIENTSLPSLYLKPFSGPVLLKRRDECAKVTELARTLNLQPFDLSRNVGQFSGGNQQKVLLGKALSREVRLFIFDEPTVGVDVGTRVAIYQFIAQLCEAGAGVLLISSDLPEILHLTNRAYVMFRGHLRTELKGEEIAEDRILSCFFSRAA